MGSDCGVIDHIPGAPRLGPSEELALGATDVGYVLATYVESAVDVIGLLPR